MRDQGMTQLAIEGQKFDGEIKLKRRALEQFHMACVYGTFGKGRRSELREVHGQLQLWVGDEWGLKGLTALLEWLRPR